MKLNHLIYENRDLWEAKSYNVSTYDRAKVITNTHENPEWIHFGAGNIFRSFQANIAEELLEKGLIETGIIAVEGYDLEIIDSSYTPCDNLGIYVKLNANGEIEKRVIGSVTESLKMASGEKDLERIEEIFTKASLKMASFTITEKGYALSNNKGEMFTFIQADIDNGPTKVNSYMGHIAKLLYHRYLNGAHPLALVSMDNCSHNGDKLKHAMLTIIKCWCEKGYCEEGFYDYVANGEKITFPCTMIDKITPRPDEAILDILKKDGLEDIEIKRTAKSTFISSFVNAEECQYLVIEDDFPNGKIPFDNEGVYYTDLETVNKVEKMKVCTCLNPLHTSLAVYGCLLGFKRIFDEMQDATLSKMVNVLGYEEGLKVVARPKIMEPKEFLTDVIAKRLVNPFMPDTPQRIACDTSQKIAIRFGETIKSYAASDELDVNDLKIVPLVLAGWCRYLMGVDDNGNEFEISPDPSATNLIEYFSSVKLGQDLDAHIVLKDILNRKEIFGSDLYEIGLAKQVEDYFYELTRGVGSVRKTLNKYIDCEE